MLMTKRKEWYWHRTEAGEASNIVKVDRPTEVEAYKAAHKTVYDKAAAYMADPSVIDWSVTEFVPQTGKTGLRAEYFTPTVPVEFDTSDA